MSISPSISPEEFAACFEKKRSWLIRYACQRGQCQRADAEDLVQDAARSALLVLPQFNPARGTLDNWIQGIVSTLIIHDRQRREEQGIVEVGLEEVTAVAFRVEPHPREAVQPHLDALTGHLRDVAGDRFDGYTLREIAKRRDIGLTTVRKRLQEAITELKLGFRDNPPTWRRFIDDCSDHAVYNPLNTMSEFWKKGYPKQRERPQKRLRGAERRRVAMARLTRGVGGLRCH
jgi:RNA polymerase sigma factor (sigma-70 family)